MPRATVSQDPERFPLRTAPPDGYVVLKKMSWGEWLTRRDMGMHMAMEAGGRKDSRKIDIDIIQANVTRYEFQKCVVEHNLEDEQGTVLNLGSERDFVRLDPRVANEIEGLIKSLHEWDEEANEEEALFRGDTSHGSAESGSYGTETDPSPVSG